MMNCFLNYISSFDYDKVNFHTKIRASFKYLIYYMIN